MTNKFSELGLQAELAEAMEKLGYTEPTEIQKAAVPKALAGGNLAGQAPTGTGKTLAYLLPLVQGIHSESSHVQAMVLAPTYELAMQIAGELTKLIEAAGLPVRSQALIGGANITRQIDKLKKKPQIVVGSAGRMLELSRKGKLHLQQVQLLVLDEFDRLLDDQNQQGVTDIVRLLPQQRQVLLFSATAPKKAMERAGFLASPEVVQVKEAASVMPAIENLYVIAPFRDKIETLRKLVRTLPVQKGLVFVNRTFDAERTLEKLRYEGLQVESLLGNADKMARKNAVAAFKAGRLRLLLSTDLAARGLDIPDVDYVINLDVPETAQIYLHRAGRTARAGAMGRALTLVDYKEAQKLAQLEKKLSVSFSLLKKPAEDGQKKNKSRKDRTKHRF